MTDEEKEAIKELRRLLEKQNEKEIVTENLFENILRAIILIQKQQEKLEKKDETILKMAKAINNFDIDEDICKQMGQKKYCSEYDKESKCEKCIIEYFEKK